MGRASQSRAAFVREDGWMRRRGVAARRSNFDGSCGKRTRRPKDRSAGRKCPGSTALNMGRRTENSSCARLEGTRADAGHQKYGMRASDEALDQPDGIARGSSGRHRVQPSEESARYRRRRALVRPAFLAAADRPLAPLVFDALLAAAERAVALRREAARRACCESA